jgi:ABC-type nitrate/sulfonate/bicarbonate transport system permease component
VTAYRVRGLLLEVGVTAAIVAAAWAYTSGAQSYVVVSLPDMLTAFRETWFFEHFSSDILPSLERLAVGYFAAVAVGVAVGIGLGSSALARALMQPVLTFMRSIPPVALLPPAVVVLGIGNSMRMTIIAFVAVWPILLNTTDGVAELNSTMVNTARAYGLGRIRRLFYVVLPAAAPRIFAGMRTSIAFAILILVTSEMIASTNGIGHFLFRSQQTLAIPDMWAAIILLGLLGYLLNLAFGVIERRVLHWHHRSLLVTEQ